MNECCSTLEIFSLSLIVSLCLFLNVQRMQYLGLMGGRALGVYSSGWEPGHLEYWQAHARWGAARRTCPRPQRSWLQVFKHKSAPQNHWIHGWKGSLIYFSWNKGHLFISVADNEEAVVGRIVLPLVYYLPDPYSFLLLDFSGQYWVESGEREGCWYM